MSVWRSVIDGWGWDLTARAVVVVATIACAVAYLRGKWDGGSR
jgi:hypothetical protein